MDAASEEPVVIAAGSALTPPPPTTTPATPLDATARLLSSAALALAVLGVLELLGTITIGLAVKTSRLNFASRQGYAFLTQLEKSPIGLLLVVATLLGAVATLRADTDARTEQFRTIALWVALVAAAVLGIGTILAVLARFRVADLAANQPVDVLTRRVLVVFVIRNFGAATVASLIAVGALFRPRARSAGD